MNHSTNPYSTQSSESYISDPEIPHIRTNVFNRYCYNCGLSQRISLSEQARTAKSFREYHKNCPIPNFGPGDPLTR
jgi:hypothetical protein